jgi:hypothetical protein
LRQLRVLWRGFRPIRGRIMISVCLVRYWGIKLMRSLGLCRLSWRRLWRICWKCISRPKCPIRVLQKSTKRSIKRWIIKLHGNRLKTLLSTFITRKTPTQSSKNSTFSSNSTKNQEISVWPRDWPGNSKQLYCHRNKSASWDSSSSSNVCSTSNWRTMKNYWNLWCATSSKRILTMTVLSTRMSLSW